MAQDDFAGRVIYEETWRLQHPEVAARGGADFIIIDVTDRIFDDFSVTPAGRPNGKPLGVL